MIGIIEFGIDIMLYLLHSRIIVTIIQHIFYRNGSGYDVIASDLLQLHMQGHTLMQSSQKLLLKHLAHIT